jgi:Na+-translocating ferredoxin:NAD+ oxidoreductase RnfG subunit
LTQSEALRIAFPEPATIERRTAYLSERELEAARALAGPGVEVEQSVVTYYVGVRDDRPVGVAYFDAHRVRTLPEVVMIVVSPEGTVERVEVLKFSEPPEYRLPENWLRQLRGHALTDELALKRAIVNMTGATLSAQAITQATRRVLALHEVIRPLAGWVAG